MIPDSKQRLENGLTDLEALLVHPTCDRAYYFRKMQDPRFQRRKERRPKMSSRTEKQLFRDEILIRSDIFPAVEIEQNPINIHLNYEGTSGSSTATVMNAVALIYGVSVYF